ncbi:uncharacterized protein LOC123405178 [Hordeum vulgare subsp. vulgare]|uniref:uncharacterized protein LOC123405178 n=1 Tax=Hordeum vulgare subsp. vulgare TaxID=112509 RepID=UPI001D1A5A9A|nr:uncharacterized protein LOC123405178 [Hordeum vulgare subsp. vulgare]
MAATAGAAAEIVREIAAVGAADLVAAAEPLRADFLRLARKVSLLTHLVAEVAEAAGEDGAAEPEATAWVANLLRAPLRVEMGTRRPLVLQMVHDPTALDPRCRFQVRDALHLF